VDGAPGVAGRGRRRRRRVDNPEEACPCFSAQDTIDDDADGRRDEGDERQRFYRCSGNTAHRLHRDRRRHRHLRLAADLAATSATASPCPTATTSVATAPSTKASPQGGRPRPPLARTATASRRTRTGASTRSTVRSCASRPSRTRTTRRPAISSRPPSASSCSKALRAPSEVHLRRGHRRHDRGMV
jgi:hypothetical protein